MQKSAKTQTGFPGFHIEFIKIKIRFYKGADPIVTQFFFNHEMVIDVIIAFLLALCMIPVLRLML